MELTTEELDHIIERQLQAAQRITRAQYDEACRQRDDARQELADIVQVTPGNDRVREQRMQELRDEVARCHEQLETARQTVADHDEARQLAVEGRQELMREVERLQRENNDLHQGWAADKRAAPPAGAVWVTEQELRNVIRSAYNAWKADGTTFNTSALRAIEQLQQRVAAQPLPLPVLNVYARWIPKQFGKPGHWVLRAYIVERPVAGQDVLAFTVQSDGSLINVSHVKLHADGVTSV